MNIQRRLQGSLMLAALLLTCLTGWRAMSIAEAPALRGTETPSLPVGSLAGGVLVQWEQTRVLLEPRRGPGASLKVGQRVEIGEARFSLRASEPSSLTILRRPWSVYAHATQGFRRIDFGSDPLGREDGVRDRVLLPGEGGAFHLVPNRPSSEPRFLPEDRGAVLVAERDGVVVEQMGSKVVLATGQRIAVKERFDVDIGESRLRIAWVESIQAKAVSGADGEVVGYRSSLGADFVVRRLAIPATSELVLTIEDLDGGLIKSLTRAGGRQLVHGRNDRLGPMRRGVLPARAADLQLEEAIAEGLEEGWVEIGRERSTVDLPSTRSGRAPRDDLGWTLSHSLVALLEDYDRARLPTGLRALRGLSPAQGRCRPESGGGWTSLRWDEKLTAWVPGDRSGAGQVTLCEIPVVGDHVVIEVGLPASWRVGGEDWTTLPGTPQRWQSHERKASGTLSVRLDARRPAIAPDRIAAAVAGGPKGTFLQAVHVSSKAFEGWDKPGAESTSAAEAIWTPVVGDRWRAEGEAPEALASTERRVFLRIPVRAAREGLVALDVQVPGEVRGATWNGADLPASVFDRARDGFSRLSLRLSRGDNVLAVHTARPPRSPALAAGGAQFEPDEMGRPKALAQAVADRRARRAVAPDHVPRLVTSHDGPDAPAIVVERGDGSLRGGHRIRVSAGRGVAGEAEIPTDTGVVRVRSDRTHGVRVIAQGGTLWTGQGEPLDLPLHPPGSDPMWSAWSPGSRLVLAGSPVRLVLSRDEGEYRTAIPSGLPASVALSLDDDLQDDALAVLDAHLDGLSTEPVSDSHALRGAVFAMNAVSGEILACAGRDSEGAAAPTACWEDHDLRPGSSFKPLLALAALESSDPTVRSMVNGALPPGLQRAALSGSLASARLPVLPAGSRSDLPLRTRLRNFRGVATPKDRALEGALRSSDNVWFGYLGLLMHEPLREGWLQSGIADDARREAAWPPHALARAAGFGTELDLGFDLSGYVGRVPADAPTSDAALAARSVGQDQVRASPLGVAAILAAIATNGEAPRPRLDPHLPTTRVRLATPAAAARVRAALHEVVRAGTASRAFATNPYRHRIFGKTGSSQRVDAKGLPRTDSWFAGVVLPPEGTAESPVVLVAVLPGAGLGGEHAARVVDGVSRALAAARGWSSRAEASRG